MDEKRVYTWCPYCGHFTEKEPTPEQLEELKRTDKIWLVLVQEHLDCMNHKY